MGGGHDCDSIKPSGVRVITHARSGRLTTIPGEAEYCGATKHSNDTGELTALLRAVVDETARVSGVVDFCVDSTYAINVAMGKSGARDRGQWRVSPPPAEKRFSARRAAVGDPVERGPSGRVVRPR